MNEHEDNRQPGPADDLLFIKSLEKGLAVLRVLGARKRSVTLAELAQEVGMTKSAAQRMTHTLEALGYLAKHPQTRRYQLTARMLELGYGYVASNPLVELATPFLAELAQLTGESANLTEPLDNDMVYVARFVTTKYIPVNTPIGMRIPMYCTSSGRAFLSSLSDDEVLDRLHASERVARTPYTVVDPGGVLELVREAREFGYACNEQELFLGDMGIAAPVTRGSGRALGAVHVAPPTGRWSMAEARRKLAPKVMQCARAIANAARSLD